MLAQRAGVCLSGCNRGFILGNGRGCSVSFRGPLLGKLLKTPPRIWVDGFEGAGVAVRQKGGAGLVEEGKGGAVEGSLCPQLEFAGRIESGDRTMSKANNAVGSQKARVVVIAGPTAVGKTRVALALAKQLGGEIISADSVQVYKGLDVGSAKTPLNEREGVPHHLVDIVHPTEDYTAGLFFDDARAATEKVLAKGHVPIVVGGTGMYLRWYMSGKARAPKATEEVTAAVEAEIAQLVSSGGGWEAGVCMLAEAGDPTTAHSLASNDWYRLRRALEIVKVSGRPRGDFPNPDSMTGSENGSNGDIEWDYDFQCYFLYQPRAELYQWIDFRCEQMVADTGGLLEEASCLLDLGVQPDSNSASRAIGYQGAMEFLLECRAAGGMTTEERFLAFLSAFQQASRNLVKKQLTWFRSGTHSELRLFHWIDASQPLHDILAALETEYRRPPCSDTKLKGEEALREASYKEGKGLKCYQATKRIFSSSEACAPVLDWVKRTQGGKRLAPSEV